MIDPITPCGILNEAITPTIDDTETNTETIISVIGEKTDSVGIPFNFGDDSLMAYAVTGYYHVHGESFIYPYLANPTQLTSGSGAWNNTGALVEIVPANTLVKAFDIHWISISNISAVLNGIVELYSGMAGSEVKIGAVDCFRTSNFIAEGNKPIMVRQQSKNTRISARFSDSTAGTATCQIKVYGHYYG